MRTTPEEAAPSDPAAVIEQLRRTVATACRIIAFRGLAEDVLGHVSVRLDDGDVLVRCRGPLERGLLFTDPSTVHTVNLDRERALPSGFAAPNELPIHTEIMRARPEVRAVVHAHPPAVVAADLAGYGLRPIVGAYNIPASRMASDGIPVYDRAVLVNSTELAEDLVEALGDKSACVLRGHGLVTVGETVQQAVVRALSVDALARITLHASPSGTAPDPLPADDLSGLPDLGPGFNDDQNWRYQESSLALAGLALT